MYDSVENLASMVSIGLGLPETTFQHAGDTTASILAPTVFNLVKDSQKDTILAGFHTDPNFCRLMADRLSLV
ncbi:hypothetical protein E1B28_001436 [Marasmius oreades]|uniref:Uncharacterized protein n=1 Tax=Marasmius oreades TaxID=181124 RepID=A0A9P7V3F1_9AGAR|nr:uncharacterized protein E1B28_001436 [Marasmius oreades]KAG7099608.1 hypothetical protein E1B28_001436 [Marasmius oreades]